ncbi:hypothetical protein [Haloarcula pellucida]|uniref:Uncharacterized protein n=1 Tax=Haloarcula pellucida TaxID=1427151 RepID=A0A830GUZ5_9EURY|nr:hypothetical protein [Halomicroarcula pellucida]MBX0350522.1 hypothetical protein [Halomicroarcula pellucida]GGO03724.1 hypothetical protein GCM10009030_39680 [Halomicroarcula pellucida]
MQHADDTQNDTEQRTDPEPHQQLASALRCLADEVERAGRRLATDDVDIVVEDGEATLVHTFDLDVGYDFEADPEGLCEPETVTDGGGDWLQTLEDDVGLKSREANAVADAFPTEGDLLSDYVDGITFTDAEGIGHTTADRLHRWLDDTHPDAVADKRERDEAYCTTFVDLDNDAGAFIFAFICPRCDSENPLRGDPGDFSNRPFRCETCNWVPCLDGDSLTEFRDEHYEEPVAADGSGEQPDTDIYELDVELRQSETIAVEATSREEAWDALEHPHERDVQEFLAKNASQFTGALYEPQDVISVGDVEEPDISLVAEGGDA